MVVVLLRTPKRKIRMFALHLLIISLCRSYEIDFLNVLNGSECLESIISDIYISANIRLISYVHYIHYLHRYLDEVE